jgi:hypothetical protein
MILGILSVRTYLWPFWVFPHWSISIDVILTSSHCSVFMDNILMGFLHFIILWLFFSQYLSFFPYSMQLWGLPLLEGACWYWTWYSHTFRLCFVLASYLAWVNSNSAMCWRTEQCWWFVYQNFQTLLYFWRVVK